MSQHVHMLISAMMKSEDVGEVFVSGVIYPYKYDSSVTAKEIREALAKVKNAKKLKVHVNSPGGVVTEAVDMMSQIKEHTATEKHVHVVMADSAATLILLVGTHVSMIEGGEIMIHRPKAGMWGDADDMFREYELLTTKEKEICSMYAAFCKQPESDVWEKMKKETWFTAQQAKDYGFVHEVIKVNKDSQQSMITRGQMVMLGYMNVPEWVMNRLPERVEEPKGPSGRPLETFGGEAFGTAGSAVTAAFSNIQNEGETETMTMEELRSKHGDLVMQIENDAWKAGTVEERARMKALDDVAAPGYEKMINDAKYGEKTMTAPEVAMQIIMAQKGQGQAFLATRTAETAQLNMVPAAPAPAKPDDKAEMEKAAEMCAGFAQDRSTVRSAQ